MSPPDREAPLLRFGDFELDPGTGELWRSGEPVALAPQPTRLLVLLARSAGRLVSRERIRDRLWDEPPLEVDPAINHTVSQLRDALGDDASDPRWIETVPRRGYRFSGPLREVTDPRPPGPRVPATADATTGESGPDSTAGDGPGRRHIVALLGLALLLAAAAAGLVLAGGERYEHTVAVVPVRAAVAGSEGEALARSLTAELEAGLAALAPDRLRVIPWTWTMRYDQEGGRVEENGRDVGVDFALDATVSGSPAPETVAVALLSIADGREVWRRRFSVEPGDPDATVTRIRERVVEEVRTHLLRGRSGS